MTNTLVRTASLPREASIFTAELNAMKMVLNVVRVIFTDSRISVQALVSNKNVNASQNK